MADLRTTERVTMKKLLTLLASAGLLLAGLVGAQAQEAQVDGTFPSADRNWTPRPDCFKYHQVGGSISGLGFNDVVAEIRSKVPPLQPMRGFDQSCPAGSNAIAHINVDQIDGPNCWFWLPNAEPHSKLTFSRMESCDSRTREWVCTAVATSVGSNQYDKTADGVAKGCLWTGAGPDHLSPREDFVLTQAWN